MSTVTILKSLAGIVVPVGVGAVTRNAVNHITPPNLNAVQKIATGIGSFVIGGIVAEAGVKYMNTTIDETAKLFQQAKPVVEDAVDKAEDVVEDIKDDLVESSKKAAKKSKSAAKDVQAVAEGVVEGAKEYPSHNE